MATGTLAATNGEADDPEHQQDHGDDPQEMDREAQSSEQQYCYKGKQK